MNSSSEKIEVFVEIAIIDDLDLAHRITAAFEEAGIPIMLEHLEGGTEQQRSFRISSQRQYSEKAGRIVNSLTAIHATKKVVTTRHEQAN